MPGRCADTSSLRRPQVHKGGDCGDVEQGSRRPRSESGWPDRVVMCRRANLGLADVEVAAVARPVGVAMVKCLEAHDRWPSSMQPQTPRSGIGTAKGAPPMSLPALGLARPHLPLPSRTRCGYTSITSSDASPLLREVDPIGLGLTLSRRP